MKKIMKHFQSRLNALQKFEDNIKNSERSMVKTNPVRNSKHHNGFYLFLLSVVIPLMLVQSSCKTNKFLVIEDVLPSVKNETFNVKFEQESFDTFIIKGNLVYEIRNPYNKDLPVPDHKMGLFINGKKMGMDVEKETLIIPAKTSKEVIYPFEINSAKLKNEVMGKENELDFKSVIKFDLTDYTDMLPDYQIAVSDNFDFETSSLKPVVNNLIHKKIGNYYLTLEKQVKLRIPTFPTISASAQPVEIRLLGDGNSFININDLKNALIPFGDLLIDGKLNGLKNPFIQAIVDNDAANAMITLLSAFDDSIEVKWENIKNLLYSKTPVPVADYMIDNFFTPYVNSNAKANWQIFKSGYNSLKNTILPDMLPNLQTRGFEIIIPFEFRNNNDFPVAIPFFSSNVQYNNSQPFSMYLSLNKSIPATSTNEPDVPSEIIQGKTTKTVYAVFSFNMNAFSQGIYSLFMREHFTPGLQSVVGYDFGYGPLYFKCNLNNLGLEFK
jgi:LEA14-like dessication related protein